MSIDRFIIDGLSSGQEHAYKYLYEKHYKALCLFACQYVNDSFIAETIVGDLIYYIWLNKEDIKIEQSLRNYLLQAVKNRCINYLEQQRRQENIKILYKKELDIREQRYEEQTEYPLSGLLEKELDLKIEASLNAMPELTRKIFKLSRFSNLKYQEIALETNQSIDTVKYHIKSALSRLRNDLKDYLLILIIAFSKFF